MIKVMLATAVLAALAAVPAPASAKTYYIVKDASTNHCRVSLRKPQGHRVLRVGEDTFTNEQEARTAMKGASDCQQP